MKSQQIVIFDKETRCFLASSEKPCAPDEQLKIDFLNAFRNAAGSDSIERSDFKLETPPLEWGKMVSDSTYGFIKFPEIFSLGFVTILDMYNLLPNHTYRLTLNGNPKLEGNELLPDTVPGLSIEKYYDFLFITTDNNGQYHAELGIYLKPGNYNVRFYVKDPDDWKIVLYHNYFKFKVMK